MIEFEKAVEFEVSDMQYIGEQSKVAIEFDAKKGIMQDDTAGHSYRSYNYVINKSKNKYPRQISNQTSFVDMTLTGDMWDRMTIESTNNSTTIKFSDLDRHKVIRNREWGRDLVGLNTKNKEMVVDLLNDIIVSNIEEKVNQDISMEMSINI